MHTAIGSSLRIFQEQAMEIAFRALKRHGVVSAHATRAARTLLMGPERTAAWQGGPPSAAPIRCMLNIYAGSAAGSGVQLRSEQERQPAGQLDWFTGVLAASVE